MKILMISNERDVHIEIVGWGLRKLGYNPTIWKWSNFPKCDILNWSLNKNEGSELSSIISGENIVFPFDVIWYKTQGTVSPMIATHKDDIAIVKTEADAFIKAVIPFLGHSKTRWINHPEHANQARKKTVQLLVAKEVGFNIPDTIISNNFRQVREFFEKHNGNIVSKHFFQGGWTNPDGTTKMLRTTKVTEAALCEEYSIRACPAIFQELVEKDFELRVTVMGDQVLCGAIHSLMDDSVIDWRYNGKPGKVDLKAYNPSEKLKELCLNYCRKMGLLFGCIDLIVKKSGEIVFLEINEAGQFLWKEALDPSLMMLGSFCNFITETSGNSNTKAQSLTMDAYLESINSIQSEDSLVFAV